MYKTKDKIEMVNTAIQDANKAAKYARVQLQSTDDLLQATQNHLDGIDDSNSRIAASVQRIQDTSTTFRAAEARLTFEHARLKRACRNIRSSLDELRESRNELRQKQEQSRKVLVFSGMTTDLIERIEENMRLGLPVDDLIAEGMDLSARHKASR